MKLFNKLQTHLTIESDLENGITDKPTVNDKIRNYTLGLGHKRYYNNALYAESVVGINLWNHTRALSYSGNGITVDYDNTTGFYTINGTATSTNSVFINSGTSSPALYALSGKTITLSLQNKSGTVVDAGSGSSAVVGRQGDNTVDAVVHITENSRTTVLPADVNHLRFYIVSGAVFTNLKFQVQFEIGSVATQWVPYVPAVSPSSALPIVTAGNGVYSLGAVKAGTFSSGGVTAVVSAQTVNINCSANTGLFFVRLFDGAIATTFNDYLALKNLTYERPANIQYTIRVTNVSGTTSNVSFPAVAVLFEDTTSDASTRKVLYPYNGVTSLTFTRASALTAIVVGINATGVTATNCTFTVELVSAMQETTAKTEITAYAHYDSTTYNFTFTAKDALKQSLINNALTIGNYASEVCVRNGESDALIKTRKYEFDGTENWVYSETFNGYYLLVTGLINTETCLSNYGTDDTHKPSPTSPYVRPVEDVLRLYHFYPYFATVAELKAALSANHLILYVPLTTPVEIEIEPLPNMQTFYPYTKITSSADGVPIAITAEVRELGNRAHITAKIIDENGNYLVDENGNYICGSY